MDLPFQNNDYVVYRVGTGTSGLGGESDPVYLDEYAPPGVNGNMGSQAELVETVPMPVQASTNGNLPLTGSGNALSEGQLSLSPNGEYLALTGYDSVPTTSGTISATTSTAVPRTVAIVGPTGSVNSSTALTDFSSGDNVRSAVTTDGTNIWVSGNSGGVAYTTLGDDISTPVETSEPNVRQLQIVDGQLFVSSQKSVTVAPVGIGTPFSAANPTLTNLTGVAGNGEVTNGYFFAQVQYRQRRTGHALSDRQLRPR